LFSLENELLANQSLGNTLLAHKQAISRTSSGNTYNEKLKMIYKN